MVGLEHRRPTLRFAWSALSEEELHWATYRYIAPKVTPPVYFHGNYNYKEHNNTVCQSRFLSTNFFFHVVTTISYPFSPVTNKSLHAVLVKISRGDPLSLSPLLKRTTHCLAVLRATVWSVQTFSKHRWMSVGATFSTWRYSAPLFCLIRTSMSDTIMSDCPSAAICHTATTWNGILVGRFIVYCHTTSIRLWHCGPTG